ncbi:MAG: histidine kinase [Planctomycetota bacterium]
MTADARDARGSLGGRAWLTLVALWTLPYALITGLRYAQGGVPPALGIAGFLLVSAVATYFWVPVHALALTLAARWPLQRRAPVRSAARHVVTGVVVALLYAALLAALQPFDGRTDTADAWSARWVQSLGGSLASSLFMYALLVAVGTAIHHAQMAQQRTLEAAELRAGLTAARLAALRARLQPHFLFNALNTVSAAVREGDRHHAVALIAQLSDLLRAVLADEERPFVPLAAELELVDRYLAIERARFGDRLRADVHLPASLSRFPVPSLVVQPLVENAIKHGVSCDPGPGRVEVHAAAAAEGLVLRVTNTGPPVASTAFMAAGTGLRATRERLATLYGGRARLDVRPSSAGGATAELFLPRPSS